MSMEGKGWKLVARSSSGESTQKSREIGRVLVGGYDIGLPADYVECALRRHFSSCGEITDVFIPKFDNEIYGRHAFIYFLGDEAVDNALQLHGSDVGGWIASVKNHPFPENANDKAKVKVEGYDPSLSETKIESTMRKIFSSYGTISEVEVLSWYTIVHLRGEGVAEKVADLDPICILGRKVTLKLLAGLIKSTVHYRRRTKGGRSVRRPWVYGNSQTKD